MNREIKFRAWEKEFHKDHPKPIPKMLDWNFLKNFYILDLFQDGLILMQYTGLKDKNGKEIYEGDILEHCNYISHGQGHKYYNIVVKWDNKYYRFNIPKLFRTTEYLKIIGNIYENSELL